MKTHQKQKLKNPSACNDESLVSSIVAIGRWIFSQESSSNNESYGTSQVSPNLQWSSPNSINQEEKY
jgi:hypothetical protein